MQKESYNNSAVPLLNGDSKKNNGVLDVSCLAVRFYTLSLVILRFFFILLRAAFLRHTYSPHFDSSGTSIVRSHISCAWHINCDVFNLSAILFHSNSNVGWSFWRLDTLGICFLFVESDLVRTWNSLQINSNFRTLWNHFAVAFFVNI